MPPFLKQGALGTQRLHGAIVAAQNATVATQRAPKPAKLRGRNRLDLTGDGVGVARFEAGGRGGRALLVEPHLGEVERACQQVEIDALLLGRRVSHQSVIERGEKGRQKLVFCDLHNAAVFCVWGGLCREWNPAVEENYEDGLRALV